MTMRQRSRVRRYWRNLRRHAMRIETIGLAGAILAGILVRHVVGAP